MATTTADTQKLIDDISSKDILELMGATHMNDDERIEMYKTMLETIENRVFDRIDEQLSDAQAMQWKEVLEKGDQKNIQEFLKQCNINIEELYAKEALIYKVQMVQLGRVVGGKQHES